MCLSSLFLSHLSYVCYLKLFFVIFTQKRVRDVAKSAKVEVKSRVGLVAPSKIVHSMSLLVPRYLAEFQFTLRYTL